VRGKEEAKNLQARLGAERGEAISRASDEQGVRVPHISIFAEISKDVKLFSGGSVCSSTATLVHPELRRGCAPDVRRKKECKVKGACATKLTCTSKVTDYQLFFRSTLFQGIAS
jgi:hypothetical protein